jgi:hypothetical protein
LRTPLLVLAIAIGAAGCGSSTQSPKQQVESATSALFTNLKQGNYGAACDAYTHTVQRLIVTSWHKLSHSTTTDCAAALSAILSFSSSVKAALNSLSAPKFDAVRVHGSHAKVTITLRGTGIDARNTFTLVRVGSAWKIGKATGLSL